MKKLLILSILFISHSGFSNVIDTATLERPKDCKVNASIARYSLPPTPNNMSLPSFGQAVIGWGTGPEGAYAKLNSVNQRDIEKYKNQSVSLNMLETWQAFYQNETLRNPCNPTAPIRAELMGKIIKLWNA